MLKGCLFENGLGMCFYGDPSDLNSLHVTVRKILTVVVDYDLEDTDVSILLVGFLEKIEQGYSGIGLTGISLSIKGKQMPYCFGCSWIELLTINGLLRTIEDYADTDELDQVNMLLLEYLLAKETSRMEVEDAAIINRCIGRKFSYLSIKQFIADFNYDIDDCGSEMDVSALINKRYES